MNFRSRILCICLALLPSISTLQAQTATPLRTVMDTELGSMFSRPNGFPYTAFGAYIGAGGYSTMLASESLKGHYSHFNHFGNGDTELGFPYTLLRQYEAEEVAAGRPPIFVTATYAGKKRPVVYLTYLALNGKHQPTTPESTWSYAVNVQDERFIKFWLHQYARPVVLQPMVELNNAWVYMDGCAFDYAAYGVIDDNGVYVGGIPWDPPFQQNANDYMASIAYFFNRVQQLAPDIKFMTDVGTMSDPTQFPTIYKNVEGALQEDALAWYKSPAPQYMHHQFYTEILPWFSWLAGTGRVGFMGANLTLNWQPFELLTAFIVYELVKGPNFFFAPRHSIAPNGFTRIPFPPAMWEGWNAALGDPISTYQQGPQLPKTDVSSRLLWRQYRNGYVYLNWTGVSQTVKLPAGNWVDPQHNPATSITIPDETGTFVTTAALPQTAPWPMISPRSPYKMTGPVTVTISSSLSNASIHYTVKGGVPTASSPVYTVPFQLNTSAVVQARVFAPGYNASVPSSATFNIAAGAPAVQFSLPSDTGPATGSGSSSTIFPVLVLSAASNQPVSVTYAVVNPQGQSTTGTAAILPGEMYGQFPLNISGAGTWKISIIAADGAVLGSALTFQYSAQ